MIVPVPETMEPELEEAADSAGGAAAATLLAEGGAAEADAAPPAIGETVPVPFWAIAICWNMAWVLLAVGLMEKVIPFPQ